MSSYEIDLEVVKQFRVANALLDIEVEEYRRGRFDEIRRPVLREINRLLELGAPKTAISGLIGTKDYRTVQAWIEDASMLPAEVSNGLVGGFAVFEDDNHAGLRVWVKPLSLRDDPNYGGLISKLVVDGVTVEVPEIYQYFSAVNGFGDNHAEDWFRAVYAAWGDNWQEFEPFVVRSVQAVSG